MWQVGGPEHQRLACVVLTNNIPVGSPQKDWALNSPDRIFCLSGFTKAVFMFMKFPSRLMSLGVNYLVVRNGSKAS